MYPYRRNAISRPSPKQFKLYKTFIILAVLGMLREADELMRREGRIVRKVARYLRETLSTPTRQLYRGMLIEPSAVPANHIAQPHGVQFVSFSEDLQVACWFAAKTAIMAEVVLMQKPKAEGWVGEYIPQKDEILFHYTWIDQLTQGPGPNIYQLALDLTQQLGGTDEAMQFRYHMMHQKEVICESHVEYPIKPVEDYACDPANELDNQFIPRGDFVLAPPGLQQLGIHPGTRLDIDRAIFHRPPRSCYQCQMPAVRATYILAAPIVVDICGNCMYVFRNPIQGQRF